MSVEMTSSFYLNEPCVHHCNARRAATALLACADCPIMLFPSWLTVPLVLVLTTAHSPHVSIPKSSCEHAVPIIVPCYYLGKTRFRVARTDLYISPYDTSVQWPLIRSRYL